MLNRQYTREALADLKYVAIDIKIKDDTTEAGIYGLFLGYKQLTFDENENTKTSEHFLWIYSKKCVYLYSLKYYEVKSIEISLGDGGKTTQFENFAGKQTEAVKNILEIVGALRSQNKIQSNGLVDVYKYESLPLNLKEHLECSTETIAPTGNTYNHNVNASLYGNVNRRSYTPQIPYKRKEIGTFFIERTTKYPVEEALEKMKTKIESIKNGTYNTPKLKKTLEDKKDPANKTDIKDDDEDHTADNEDFYSYGGMYGCL